MKKKADKWTPAMAKATKERDNAKTPAAKAKAQKKINAAYKAAGLDMKGKKKKMAVGGTIVKKKATPKKPTAKKPTKAIKKSKTIKTGGAKNKAELKRNMKANAFSQDFTNKMEREEYNKKTKKKLKNKSDKLRNKRKSK